MTFEFSIQAWSAYADGLDTQAGWQAWAARPVLPTGQQPPELTELPVMARRRLGLIGRMAAQVGFWCQEQAGRMPVVMVSRYGEAERSIGLLREQAMGNALSPTAFGLSVHNAIGAQYSIARADRGNYVALAGGGASVVGGVVEALGLLSDGADAVLLVCYDAPLPDDYAAFADEPAGRYAWAWVMVPPQQADGAHFSLRPVGAADAAADAGLPYGLDVLRFILSGDELLRRGADGCAWEWRRHA